MDGPGDELLTRTGFSVEEDGGICGRHAPHLIHYWVEGSASADDRFIMVCHVGIIFANVLSLG